MSKETKTTEKQKIIIIRETLLSSLISDAVTFVTVLSIIGIGVWLHSAAMQWMGFLMVLVTLGSRLSGTKEKYQKTPQEAADYLKEEFDVAPR